MHAFPIAETIGSIAGGIAGIIATEIAKEFCKNNGINGLPRACIISAATTASHAVGNYTATAVVATALIDPMTVATNHVTTPIMATAHGLFILNEFLQDEVYQFSN